MIAFVLKLCLLFIIFYQLKQNQLFVLTDDYLSVDIEQKSNAITMIGHGFDFQIGEIMAVFILPLAA